MTNTLFFISGGEIAFVLFIIVIVFGADKIPGIAKGLGKGMKSIKNATNEIKNEIKQTAEDHQIDTGATKSIQEEIHKVKNEIDDLKGSVSRKF